MKIKICGLQEPLHAIKAAELGADFLGFVFAASPRQVTPDQARGVIRQLPAGPLKVGVFVNEMPEVINETVTYCGLDMVQLHGRETPDECRRIKCPVIKGFRVRDAGFLAGMKEYLGAVEIFLLDTYVRGKTGGTGRTFDWSLACQAAALGKIMLAGGLNPENVRKAIKAARPYAVDVSSGVETGGVKDIAKIEAFIRQVRGRDNVYITG